MRSLADYCYLFLYLALYVDLYSQRAIPGRELRCRGTEGTQTAQLRQA